MGKFATLILAAVAVFGQIAADRYSGTYTGKDLRVELRAAAGGYTGTLHVQGQSFPLAARETGNQLSGTFSSGANRFPFQATLSDGQLRLISDNSEHLLFRASAATANQHPKGFRLQPAAGWTTRNNDESVPLIPADATKEEIYVPAGGSALSQQWQRKLQGKMIRQFSAYQGMSSDKRHYLNADGTYLFRSAGMVSVDTGGASAMSSGNNALRGRWRIAEADGNVYLLIQYNDGDTGRYRLTQDARNWYMNGEKSFAVDPE